MGYYHGGDETLQEQDIQNLSGWLSWIPAIGKGAVNVGKAVAPVVGAGVGFAVGGPAGAAIGGAAGQALKGGKQSATPPGGPQTIIMGPSTGGQAAQPTIYMQPPQQKSAFPIPTWALIGGGVTITGLVLFFALRRRK